MCGRAVPGHLFFIKKGQNVCSLQRAESISQTCRQSNQGLTLASSNMHADTWAQWASLSLAPELRKCLLYPAKMWPAKACFFFKKDRLLFGGCLKAGV